MRSVLIIGAGAIGRGYLPWIFKNTGIAFDFIDTNEKLVEQMKKQSSFKIYRVQSETLDELVVSVQSAWTLKEFSAEKLLSRRRYEAVVMNVGPRNVGSAAKVLHGYTGPIVLCENDPATVETVKTTCDSESVVFAVPDVITSNTAPSHLLKEDPLSVVTEVGELFIDEKLRELNPTLKGNFQLIPERELLDRQWMAKLYLHNTPHCVAAYLGALAGRTYLHESMQIKEAEKIIRGSMNEMLNALKLRWEIPHDFLDWYAKKELSRFASINLCDPIARVAREPLRKLDLDGRLLGAAQICLSMGFIPENILKGIGAALLFENESDPDHQVAFMRRALGPGPLVRNILSLRKGEALERLLTERLSSIWLELESLIGRKDFHK